MHFYSGLPMHLLSGVDSLPVHSFRSLLSDLATLCLNKVSLPSNQKYRFELPTMPTPLQARAGELLGVSLGV